MPNLTDATLHLRRADTELDTGPADLLEQILEGAKESRGPVIEAYIPELVPYEISALIRSSIPFYGHHGSHSGDYPAYAVAFDGHTYMEHESSETGFLACASLLDHGTLDDDARVFIAHYRRTQSLIHEDAAATFDPTDTFTSPAEAIELIGRLPEARQLDALIELVRHNVNVDEFGFAAEAVTEFQTLSA